MQRAASASGMDEDRPRPRPIDAPVMHLSPTRAELVRYFAWGYLSRRELNELLARNNPEEHSTRPAA
jgi:hypothetical protein